MKRAKIEERTKRDEEVHPFVGYVGNNTEFYKRIPLLLHTAESILNFEI